jgi:hypothetical protein
MVDDFRKVLGYGWKEVREEQCWSSPEQAGLRHGLGSFGDCMAREEADDQVSDSERTSTRLGKGSEWLVYGCWVHRVS